MTLRASIPYHSHIEISIALWWIVLVSMPRAKKSNLKAWRAPQRRSEETPAEPKREPCALEQCADDETGDEHGYSSCKYDSGGSDDEAYSGGAQATLNMHLGHKAVQGSTVAAVSTVESPSNTQPVCSSELHIPR